MGKSTNQIYLDYKSMRQKADQLEKLANEITALKENKIAEYRFNNRYWQGDSGDVCRQKLKKVEANLDRRAKELRNTAKALRGVAERHYKIEMALVALASK